MATQGAHRAAAGGQRGPLLLALVVFLVTGYVACLVWRALTDASDRAHLAAHEAEATQVVERLAARIHVYENSLRGAQGLFAASKSVEREEWRAYVEGLDLHERYPGVQGIGYASRVATTDLETFVASVRADGLPDYRVFPPPQGPESFPVIFLEPYRDRNVRPMGFDISSEPVRRAAMMTATDADRATMSGILTLKQEDGDRPQPGTLLLLPVYANGRPRATIEERRASLVGFVLCPIRMHDFLKAALSDRAKALLQVEVYDGAEISAQSRLNLLDAPYSAPHEPDPLVRQLNVAGRLWTLRFPPAPDDFWKNHRRKAELQGAAGLVVAFLLSLVAWLLAGTRARALKLAGEMSESARSSEEAAREALSRFEQLARLAPIPIFTTDAVGGCTFANEAWCRNAGLTLEQALGDGWKRALHPADSERLSREWGDALAKGTDFVGMVHFQRPDGSSTWSDARVTAHRDEQGRVTGYLGAAMDVTERLKIEALLRQRADELARVNTELRLRDQEIRLLFERTSDAVVTMDAAGLIRSWNPRAESLFGWREIEVIGKSVAETMVPESLREAHRTGLARFLETGEGPALGRMLELSAMRRDGSEFPVEVILVPTQGPHSWQFTSFIRDITGRKSAEAELQKASEAANAANRAKSEFLANVSHEIRTPMNGILGMTELALGTNLTEEQREYLDTVKKSAKGLLAILNSVLDFSKIEAGKLEVDHITFSVRTVIDDVTRLHSFRAQEKRIRLFGVVSPDVPERVTGDPLRLGQVLGNLVSNALKFTDRGEVEVRAAIERIPGESPMLHFSVRDSGIGIPANKQALLFQEFTQVDASATRKFGGTGLGLAISSRLVGLMGGKIWVESEPGKGATFHFTIALNAARTMASDAPSIVAPGSDPVRRIRVLVADDNPVNQRLAAAILTKRGHDVVVASDGASALESLRQGAFDAILMDVQMPDMDGIQATQAIRRGDAGDRAKTIPIIAMTAHAMLGDRDRFMREGMSDYLSKPVDARELVTMVEGLAATGGKVGSRAFAAAEALERVGGDPDVLKELAVTFVRDYDRMKKAIHDAALTRNMQGLERAGHSIRGAAGIFSATRTVMAAQAVDELARVKDPAVFAAVPALEVELKRLRDELERLVSEGRL